jgi:hypothetical protein
MDRLGALVSKHAIHSLRLPADTTVVGDTLERA